MKKILFAHDGTDCANAALEELRYAGLPDDLDLRVICNADTCRQPGEDPAGEAERERPVAAPALRRPVADHLARCGPQTVQAVLRLVRQHPRWRVDAASSPGPTVPALVRAARQWQPDLTVLGSRAASGVARFIGGGEALGVARAATCSVHLARPRSHPAGAPLRLLVAIDGSPDSRAAVRAIASRHWPTGTQVQVITVIDSPQKSALVLPTLHAAEWTQQHDANASEWLCRFVRQAKDQLTEAGLDVEARIFDGHPLSLLLGYASEWDADVMFIGARGLNHGKDRALGRLASALVQRAPCSVEIVRQV